jgi:UPF0176 protein
MNFRINKNQTNKMTEKIDTWKVAALYRFVALHHLEDLQVRLKTHCDDLGVCGTLLIAPEGVNGTIAGSHQAIDDMIDILDQLCDVRQGEVKYASASAKPFRRMKVRIKKEIITMRTDKAKPEEIVGTYVDPKDWNDIISDPDMIVLDTRNDYEIAIGTFENAINPDIKVFTEFAPYVEANLDPKKHKKIAMFCTGGIRCEKASSYMLNQGFENVYHLKGGILKYLEEIPEEQSLWKGDCFVFDRRVGVGHGLKEGRYDMCYSCGWPLTYEEVRHPSYEKGVSCLYCIDDLTEERAFGFRMRQQQSEQGLFKWD